MSEYRREDTASWDAQEVEDIHNQVYRTVRKLL